ncbi:hypothetical protein THAOC_04355 [Thalassiosira oceanica]|uniref:Uncharacterized protein n=1 Tax=Thalassiosira oceanica TaxID=159749 RepID=K0TA60_THAOC|nr:hypothetical protein THAOC_04355 [Thalassiosira oceanica]|mmetsp:Transcript_22457/g.52972  ORF Transcript_22457/g.52972 Transcript_22457/m.52972 type:complete len:523 (-) Transcript_22457:1993-3561(-)|eukprot:EJK73994.1 hypothetical protein THAOC_04355 [Thalassiosira oceanica]
MLSYIQEQLKVSATTKPLEEIALGRKADSRTDGESAFVYTGPACAAEIPRDTTRVRVDASVKRLHGQTNFGPIFSLELPENVIRMDVNETLPATVGRTFAPMANAFFMPQRQDPIERRRDLFKSEGLKHLRNVAFPPDLTDKSLPTFENSSDLGRILPSDRNTSYAYSLYCNGFALRDRFKHLPLHRIAYYHVYDSEEVAVEKLRKELEPLKPSIVHPDCLKMYAHHILCCSTKHRPMMYRLLLEKLPMDLFSKDCWGCLPLFYLIWGLAPLEIVDLVVQTMKEEMAGDRECYNTLRGAPEEGNPWLSLKSNNPFTREINWKEMVETLCEARAPLACLDRLIEINIFSFPEDNLQSLIDWGEMMIILCSKGKARKPHLSGFVQLCHSNFGTKSIVLEQVAMKIVRREKFGFKPFWLRVCVGNRIKVLQYKEWRYELDSMINTCPVGSTERHRKQRIELMTTVLDKLKVYEVYGLMWVLELALWKSKLEYEGLTESQDRGVRAECRFTCGATFIMPKVISYLI